MRSRIKCWAAVALLSLVSQGCRDVSAPIILDSTDTTHPSISKQFACLPKDAAFLAAHRGTSHGSEYPENSISGLKALIDKGFYFAEVDIAKIKDGTHILFHDGVWEEKSTGKGVIAATSRSEYEAILLRDTNNQLSADRPPSLKDVLSLAKDKIYLEIDFKSSANYKSVIDLIRADNMANQVILIAYNSDQAAILAKLAPDMMISVSARYAKDISALERSGVKPEQMAIWRGRYPDSDDFRALLEKRNLPVLRLGQDGSLKQAAKTSSLIVTDHAFDLTPIIGLTDTLRTQYEACLSR